MLELLSVLAVVLLPSIASAQAPATGEAVRVYALSDRLPIYLEMDLRRLEQAVPPKQRSGAAPASMAAALTTARKELGKLATPDDVRALDEIATQADARSLQLAALELLFVRRPAVALELLLRAQAKAPDDPAVLLNLANVLALTGFGREALQVLDELDRRTGSAGGSSSSTSR